MPFSRFWPIYLAEHRSRRNRALHLAGTLGYLALLAFLLATHRPAWLWTVPVLAYGCAWTGHFFIEKNRPATFQHPWLSLIGDHRMAVLILTGRIGSEFQRLGISEKA
ncbi:MAG TPA: DUF962 domain-containing protein [Holophagaceae bacterium]|nr:DUF962 domain-containing protein [Holophagaceae bacterium]